MEAQVISFRCVLKNKLGQVLSTSFNQDVLTLHGDQSVPLEGLVRGLQNIRQGEKRQIFVPAAQAYGFYDLAKTKRIALEDVSGDLKIGGLMRLQDDSMTYRVIEIGEGFATLDGNHPLAGQDLIFEVEATKVRSATASDLDEPAGISSSIIYH